MIFRRTNDVIEKKDIQVKTNLRLQLSTLEGTWHTVNDLRDTSHLNISLTTKYLFFVTCYRGYVSTLISREMSCHPLFS